MPETIVPHIPDTAPFSKEQRAWLNGLLAGLYSGQAVDPESLLGEAAPSAPVTILYGSQTGTTEGLARETASALEEAGFRPTVYDMMDYEVEALTDEQYVLLMSSTYGEGDMPDNAELFWEDLASDAAPRLEHVGFSVLALGDTSYLDFCEAGKQLDRRMEELGADRFAPRVDCDVDYEAPFQEWLDRVIDALSDRVEAEAEDGADTETRDPTSSGDQVPAPASVAVEASSPPAPTYSRQRPLQAPLMTNRRLNGEGSNKDTRHFEISLEDSDLAYEVGDSLGVVPTNCSELVASWLDVLGCDGDEPITVAHGDDAMSLREALRNRYEIRTPSRAFLKKLADRTDAAALKQRLAPEARDELDDYLWGRCMIDIVLEHAAGGWAPQAFVDLLDPLKPRLYSIASSPTAHAGEVHLTVATVRYASHGRDRKGVCSTFLADRVSTGETVPVYVQKNKHFSLPADDTTPIVMVGPGTGIAPFRAFLHERQATNATGRNWLFFGDQHADTDFLYEDELTSMYETGHLDRLDTAFSRDQREKVYVQHRMLEHAEALFDWLEDGAHVYVCGDADRMARDVDAALHRVIQQGGGYAEEAAARYVRQMKKDKRYQRDVY